MPHIPVLLYEVMKLLAPKPGETFIDGTLGSGGHAMEILKRIEPNGIFIGIDQSGKAVDDFKKEIAASVFRSKIIILKNNYAYIPNVLKKNELDGVDGLLLDLGFSSEELEASGRGFSFQRDEPLDMRYDAEGGVSAGQALNQLGEEELENIFRTYGEERFSRRIAREISARRKSAPLSTTRDLVSVVLKAVPLRHPRGRVHPATRVFQALRIYVNHELENLKLIMEALPTVMRRGGRVAVISFHSLEDRIVKHSFQQFKKSGKGSPLTEKPIQSSIEECRKNPRSRSAKLRVFQWT